MIRKLIQVAFLGFLMVTGARLHGQAMNMPIMEVPTSQPNAGSAWYGKTEGALLVYLQQMGTHPFYEPGSTSPTSIMAPSMPMYPLSMDSAYHNAMAYERALIVANSVRSLNLTNAQAKNVKEGADPLVGKGPASLSFWQWLKLGEMGLKLYGKVSAIVKALHSGQVVIDVWKLMPKVSVTSEDDPLAPVIVMGLVPYSNSALALAKRLINFSDPRYYGGNLVKFDDLDRLVPSLAVKPSFYGAYAHMATSDPASRNVKMMEMVMQNFHEMRTGLSMLNRFMMGRAHDEGDIPRSRFSTAYAAKISAEMQARADFWDDAYFEISQGAKMYGPDFADQVKSLRDPMSKMQGSERKILSDLSQTKAAFTWQAKALAGTLANIMGPLETDEYAQGAKMVQDMVNEYASDSSYDITHGIFNHENILLGLAVADAWTNKLIHDELHALRCIYGMSVTQEATTRLAPYVAQSFYEIQSATKRLTTLQNTLASLQAGQAVNGSSFFNGDDIARVANRMDIPPK